MPPKPSCLCGTCNKCKRRAYMRDWNARNPDAAKAHAARRRERDGATVRAQDRARYERDKEKRRAANRAYVAENRERETARRLEWERQNPEKKRAHQTVKRAVKRGDLVRPDACPICGRSDVVVQAHHADYSKPLEVEWLCPSCHARRHPRRIDN